MLRFLTCPTVPRDDAASVDTSRVRQAGGTGGSITASREAAAIDAAPNELGRAAQDPMSERRGRRASETQVEPLLDRIDCAGRMG